MRRIPHYATEKPGWRTPIPITVTKSRRFGGGCLWIGSGCVGVRFIRHAASIVKLDAAIPAVEELSATGQTFQKVQKTSVQRIDPIRPLQFDYTIGAASRAARVRSEMIPVPPRHRLFAIALLARVNGQVAEALGKGPVYAPQPASTVPALPHGPHFYNVICLTGQAAGQ